MNRKKSDEQFSDHEAKRRFEAALKGALLAGAQQDDREAETGIISKNADCEE
jgi:hypothetical protein